MIAASLLFAGVSCKNSKNDAASGNVARNIFTEDLQKTVVHAEEINRPLKLNGRIVPDEAKQASVYALVSGRIGQVNVELGDYVRKGQTIAALKSAEVAGVNNDLTLARQNLEIARKNRDTYKELYESDLVSEREYITTKAEYEKALSELQKAENVSAITGGENSLYTLVSPINGYIIAKNITSNSEVRADMAEPLFAIADLSVVWILADVFEVDIDRIRLGQTVDVQTLSNSGKTYAGKIDKIYNVLDPETRTMKARVSLANSNNELKAGMFVSVKVEAKDRERAAAVPSSALVFENNKMYVIVLGKNNQPEIRPIKEIFRSGEKCYVEGVSDGETVITSGQVFLFEELNAQ
ncbi:MAG: efflux RND transporter periplasmic adaptor subunit [Dysgonamonadaceae bacterium]|jgi:cobalt-zinc-cadmium efflux system membrane fusion protein|nr:efflux RND transporter periplasmic adaptor subunit [Dysgonamonadaceae bacterium]